MRKAQYLRLSEAEKEYLETQAKKRGVKLSTFIREQMLYEVRKLQLVKGISESEAVKLALENVKEGKK